MSWLPSSEDIREGFLKVLEEECDDSDAAETSGYGNLEELEYLDDIKMEVIEDNDDTEADTSTVAAVPTATSTVASFLDHKPFLIQETFDLHASADAAHDVKWVPDDVTMDEDVKMNADVGNETEGGVEVKNERKGGRGRGRGCGRGRGRGRGRAGGAPASTTHLGMTPGEPLVQVCADEADVPPELQHLVRVKEANEIRLREGQMVRKREERQGAMSEEDEDVFFEADDGRDEALLSGEAACFDWRPMDTFQGTKEVFVPEKTGSVTPRHTMYEAFRAYWDDDILEKIVTETNRHASSISAEAFRKQWYPTNIHEILVLFAFWVMLGIVKMPTIKSCFSLDPFLKHDIFRKMFTSHRYINLCRAVHFCNIDARPPNATKLYLMGPIVDHLNDKFQQNYIPSQNLSLDESLTLWKGFLVFKQYIATKVAKYGIKTFELCEAATGYLWSFAVYTGQKDLAEDSSRSTLKSTSLVIKLVRPLFGKGYTLFMDNWFNSPTLARFLKRNKTDCVGPLRSTRRGVPQVVQLAQLQKGEFLARHAGDVSVLAWEDTKRIIMISTYHGTKQGQVTTGKGTRISTIYKPQVVLDYNKNIGGVDRKDQMLEPYVMMMETP